MPKVSFRMASAFVSRSSMYRPAWRGKSSAGVPITSPIRHIMSTRTAGDRIRARRPIVRSDLSAKTSGPDSVVGMDLPRPDVDPGGLLEYSVVFTDRSLNHMSQRFVTVVQDTIRVLTTTYAADTVALIPGGGTVGMEAVARQLMTGRRIVVVRNGFFSYRWSQILDQGGIAESVTVCRAQPVDGDAQSAWTPPPAEVVVEAIRRERPDVVCAAHVE